MPGTTPPDPWKIAKICVALFNVLDKIQTGALLGQRELDSCRAEVEETRRQLAEREAEQE